MLEALHGYVGGVTRLCRGRTSVMSAAHIGYVRGAHRLCTRRASMHQGRRHYYHNRYNRCDPALSLVGCLYATANLKIEFTCEARQ